MSDYKEVLHERLYVRVPGTDKLRKTAAARLQHLLANGWRETERNLTADYLKVRFERDGTCADEGSPAEEGAGDPGSAPAAARRPELRRSRASLTRPTLRPKILRFLSVFTGCSPGIMGCSR